ncbi:acinetodin/klebsidin/J25 family lasso peptide [Burkholderia sp. Bp8963]|uniref:acinetodin/klebsidin/J25 family lasso peptide n=1 Tax=Burkholderia sp. Bp8963 TaxID=2184547 RepID=UPI00163B5EB5|nr:acinetodin/klebsidin/J25 family lasso peptide [Burkholderia sp. Bp8963]
MRNGASKESFEIARVGGVDVVTLKQDACKATMGGDGGIAEYFNRPMHIYDWQIMDSGYYG